MTAATIPADPHQQAEILMQALPHMLRYDDATIVVKYGGHAMGDEDRAREFARDMVLLEQSGINPVVVHGGGPQIGAMLKKLGIEVAVRRRPAHHRQGHRRDRRDGAGRLHQQADRRHHQRRGRPRHRPLRQGRQHGDGAQGRRAACTGPSGPTGQSISASSASRNTSTRPCSTRCSGASSFPCWRPSRMGDDGETYNVNADTFAGAIAGALKAKRLLFLTDVPGVLDNEKQLIKALRRRDPRSDRRRHDHGRHDPQGARPASMRSNRASRAS